MIGGYNTGTGAGGLEIGSAWKTRATRLSPSGHVRWVGRSRARETTARGTNSLGVPGIHRGPTNRITGPDFRAKPVMGRAVWEIGEAGSSAGPGPPPGGIMFTVATPTCRLGRGNDADGGLAERRVRRDTNLLAEQDTNIGLHAARGPPQAGRQKNKKRPGRARADTRGGGRVRVSLIGNNNRGLTLGRISNLWRPRVVPVANAGPSSKRMP